MSSHRNGTLLCLRWLVSIKKKKALAHTHTRSKWNLNEWLVADLFAPSRVVQVNTNHNFLWHMYMCCHITVALPHQQADTRPVKPNNSKRTHFHFDCLPRRINVADSAAARPWPESRPDRRSSCKRSIITSICTNMLGDGGWFGLKVVCSEASFGEDFVHLCLFAYYTLPDTGLDRPVLLYLDHLLCCRYILQTSNIWCEDMWINVAKESKCYVIHMKGGYSRSSEL